MSEKRRERERERKRKRGRRREKKEACKYKSVLKGERFATNKHKRKEQQDIKGGNEMETNSEKVPKTNKQTHKGDIKNTEKENESEARKR